MNTELSIIFFVSIILIIVAFILLQNRTVSTKDTLYERLGGIFPIAAVVNKFSDKVLVNPLVGKDSPNPQLREWSRNQSPARLPGLKWLRTLWVADVTGGPYKFVHSSVKKTCPFSGLINDSKHLNLSKAHAKFQITSEQFDAVAEELSSTLDSFHVPDKEKNEVLSAFAEHKKQVVSG